MRDCDSYSLHTIGDATPIAAVDDAAANNDEDNSLVTDTVEIPAAFFSNKILLQTPPVYCKSKRFMPRLESIWKDKILGRYSPLCILVCYLAAILANQSIAATSAKSQTVMFLQWAPAFIVAFILLVTQWLATAQLHNINQRPWGPKTAHLPKLLRDHWTGALITMSLFGAPLLGISLPESEAIVYRQMTPPDGVSNEYVRLQSWVQAAPNLHATLPYLKNQVEDNAQWEEEHIRSADMWVVDNNKIKMMLPEYMSFALPGGGKGPKESRWNGVSTDTGNALYMPIQLVASRTDWSVLEVTWKVRSQVLSFGLDCEYITVNKTSHLSTSGGVLAVSVDVTDSDGCSGTLTMPGLPANDMHDSMQRILYLMEQKAYGDAQPNANALKLVETYRELLFAHESLIAYRPTWIRPAQGDSQCKTRLLIAGVGQAFSPIDRPPGQDQIQAASCRAKYSLKDIDLSLTKKGRGRFHRGQNFSSGNHGIASGELGIPSLDSFLKAAQDPTSWSSLGSRDKDSLDEAFVAEARAFSNDSRAWKLAQLRAEFDDIYWSRPTPVGALLMTGRFLGDSFVASLSTAAGLALRENLPNLPHETSADVQIWRAERSVLSKRLSYRLFLALFAFVLTVQLLYLQQLCFEAYGDEYRVKWDTSSIAARASLLRFSQAASWLRSVKAYAAKIDEPPQMLIGHWEVHKEDGSSGLRVDLVHANNPEPQIPKGYKGWIWNNMRSILYVVTEKDRDSADSVLFFFCLVFHVPILFTWVGWGWMCRNTTQMNDDHLLRMNHLLSDDTATSSEISIFWILPTMLLPTGLAYVVMNHTGPKMYNFFRLRQPWVSLKSPQPAHLGFTLDYWNATFPLWTALRNKHMRVATLAIVAMLGCMAPAVYSRAWYTEWRADPLSVTKTISSAQWEAGSILSRPLSQKSFDLALTSTMDKLLTARYQPRWSSAHAAMLPLHLDALGSADARGYWTFNTSVIVPKLECKHALVNLTMSSGLDEPFKKPSRVESIHVGFGTDDGLPVARLENPCDGKLREHKGVGLGLEEKDSREVICSRWWLHNATDPVTSNIEVYWTIALLHGEGYRSDETGSMMFNAVPQSIGLFCRPIARKQAGTVTLFSDDKKLRSAFPITYAPLGPESTLDKLSYEISIGLETSAGQLDSTAGEAEAAHSLLSTENFVGDLLSYMLYRLNYAGNHALLNWTNVAADASLLFSNYVTVLAERTDLLRRNSSEAVAIHAFQLDDYIRVNNISFTAILVLVLLAFVVIWIANYSLRDFALPIAPEPLLNGLLLLCHSSLVQKLEQEIPHPEKMSLRQFYRQIERWGHKYKFGELVTGDRIALTVDVSTVFEDDEVNRYRDDVEQDEDEDEDDGSDSDSSL